MSEEQSNLPQLPDVLQAIEMGDYDGSFDKISEAMDARREARKSELLEQVHEVFGAGATVITPMEVRGPMEDLFEPEYEEPGFQNPFIEKSERQAPPVDQMPDNDEPTPDALADSDPVIESINAGEQVPIEQRGAIIGGLSSGDIE